MKKIINRIFNEKFPPVFIAEISANHNGNIINAKKLILAAKKMVLILLSFKLTSLEI